LFVSFIQVIQDRAASQAVQASEVVQGTRVDRDQQACLDVEVSPEPWVPRVQVETPAAVDGPDLPDLLVRLEILAHLEILEHRELQVSWAV